MRARNIKPGFFENEELAECDPLARILFAGLWCMADREGRLEDRPKRIKAKILPYDDCDVSDLLEQLNQSGFILRYESGGAKYIQILNFSKHQNPHCKEATSTIPAPEEHSTGTVQVPEKHSDDPADSLIPDSGFSDSLNKKGATAPGGSEKKYVCEIQTKDSAKPLRITEKQAAEWQEVFPWIDVRAELIGLGQWEPTQDKAWSSGKSAFHACFNALKKKNQQALQDMKARDPTFDPEDPDGSKAARERYQKTLEQIVNQNPYALHGGAQQGGGHA
jgi:hypothetical protein